MRSPTLPLVSGALAYKRRRVRTLFYALASVLLVLPGVALSDDPPAYDFELFNLPSGRPNIPQAVNDAGNIAGVYVPSSRGLFLYTGEEVAISIPGAGVIQVNAINNKDQVVGIYQDAGRRVRSFTYSDGQLQTYVLPIEGVQITRLFGINDSGELVGTYSNGTTNLGFFVDRSGNVTTLPDFFPAAINNRGEIVGDYFVNRINEGSAIYRDGTLTATPPRELVPTTEPGGPRVSASDINARGDIVGSYFADVSIGRAFVYDGRNFVTLEFPGGAPVSALDINGRGVIVGRAFFADGTAQGYVATPRHGNSN